MPFLSVSISRTETYNVEVPYETKYEDDDTRYEGVETVYQEGETGTNKITAKVYYVNGEEVKRTIKKTERVKEPVTEIILQGTLPPQSSHYSNASAIRARSIYGLLTAAHSGSGAGGTAVMPDTEALI